MTAQSDPKVYLVHYLDPSQRQPTTKPTLRPGEHFSSADLTSSKNFLYIGIPIQLFFLNNSNSKNLLTKDENFVLKKIGDFRLFGNETSRAGTKLHPLETKNIDRLEFKSFF